MGHSYEHHCTGILLLISDLTNDIADGQFEPVCVAQRLKIFLQRDNLKFKLSDFSQDIRGEGLFATELGQQQPHGHR